jgi:hypothetical protein
MTLDQNIHKVKFLINYDGRKPLSEQSVPLFGYTAGSEGWKMRAESEEQIIQTLKGWNKHDWLEFAELTTGLLGMVPFPPFALAMNALSIGFGAANAAVYAAEGDPYSASIALGLSLIPGPSTLKLGKEVFGNPGGREVIQKLLLRKAAGETLTTKELNLLNKGLKELSTNSTLFNQTVKNSIKLTFREMFSKKGLEWTLKFLLTPVNKPFFRQVVFPIYGASVGVDSMYYLYTLLQKDEKKRTLEEKRMLSEFKPLVDLLKNPTQIFTLISNLINPEVMDENLEFESLEVSNERLNEGKQKLLALSKANASQKSGQTEKSSDGFPICVTGELFKKGNNLYQDKKGLFSFFNNNRVSFNKQVGGKKSMGYYSCNSKQPNYPVEISTNEFDNDYEYKIKFDNSGNVKNIETKRQKSKNWLDVTQKDEFNQKIKKDVFGIPD